MTSGPRVKGDKEARADVSYVIREWSVLEHRSRERGQREAPGTSRCLVDLNNPSGA